VIRAAAVLACLALPAGAQMLLDPAEVLDGLIGKTITAHDPQTGRVLQTEKFLSRENSVWRDGDAACVYGKVSVTAGLICFVYPDIGPQRHCWFPADLDGRLMMMNSRLLDGTILELREADTELGCNEIPIS